MRTSAPDSLSSILTERYSNPQEYAALDDLYSPMVHRVNRAIRDRAIEPEKAPAKIPEILTKYSGPPERLVDRAKPQIEALRKIADVKPGMVRMTTR